MSICQNIITSRLNARGVVISSLGTPDRNKIVKTNSLGLIDESLIPGTSSGVWNRTFEIQVQDLEALYPDLALPTPVDPDEMEPLIVGNGVEIYTPVKYVRGTSDEEDVYTTNYVMFISSFYIDIDNIVLDDTSPVSFSMGSNGDGIFKQAQISTIKNDTVLETLDLTTEIPVDVYDDFVVPKEDPEAVFSIGDYFRLAIKIYVEKDYSIFFKNVKVKFNNS